MGIFRDVWAALARDRYTDRFGVAWQFDYMVEQEWFVL